MGFFYPCGWPYLTQALRIMKLTVIILFIACLQVSARGYSQKLITLDEKNGDLAKVLEKIRQQTNMVIWYRGDLLQRTKPVTIRVKNEPVQKVFEILFKDQPLTYSIIENAIVIRPKENEGQGDKSKSNLPLDVSGRITNERGDLVVGATVSVKGSSKNAVTNANGEFTIEKVEANDVLVISSIGYEVGEIGITGRKTVNTVLKIKVTNLDEFQVIAYGQTTKRLNTGNVSTVKAVDIEKQPVDNPLLALVGRVPGLEITQATGIQGSNVK
jgi:TonB-dependent starch-binding outer membrane protein SusC